MASVVLSTVESDAYVFFNVAVCLSPPLLRCGLRSISNLSSSFASLLFSVIAFLSLPPPPSTSLFIFLFFQVLLFCCCCSCRISYLCAAPTQSRVSAYLHICYYYHFYAVLKDARAFGFTQHHSHLQSSQPSLFFPLALRLFFFFAIQLLLLRGCAAITEP